MPSPLEPARPATTLSTADATWAGPARHARLILRGDLSLIDAVAQALSALDWPSATLQIFGGPMARAVYHCAILTPNGPRWIDYGAAREVALPAALVMASATFGRDRQGGPALHCHAVLSGPGGLVGGHLAPDRCVLGAEGLVAYAISGPTAGFTIQRDQATSFDLLAPASAH